MARTRFGEVGNDFCRLGKKSTGGGRREDVVPGVGAGLGSWSVCRAGRGRVGGGAEVGQPIGRRQCSRVTQFSLTVASC